MTKKLTDIQLSMVLGEHEIGKLVSYGTTSDIFVTNGGCILQIALNDVNVDYHVPLAYWFDFEYETDLNTDDFLNGILENE